VADLYRWDDFVLDLVAYKLERAGAALPLEPKALNLLAFLVERPGRLVTKQEIFEAVWPDTAVTDHALTRVVAQLRRALGDEARESAYIETVPTRGYRWIRPLVPVKAGTGHRAALIPGFSDGDPPRAQPVPISGPSALERPPLAPASARLAPPAPAGAFRAVGAALALSIAALAFLLWSQRSETAANPASDGDAYAAALASAKRDVTWPVQVTTNRGLDLQPALSPTGDAVAYVSDKSGALEIYVRALGGTATDAPLTSDGGHNVQPAWSPDGRWLAYHSYKQGGVWVVPSRGGVPRQIAPQGSNPTWSPDGLRVALQSDEHADVTPSAWGAQTGSTLWIVDADGSNLKEMTRTGAPNGGHAAPTWSRDGRFIAFTVFEGGEQNGVWLLEVENGRTRLLTRGRGLFELVFAPDGSALYAAGGEAVVVRLPFDPVKGEIIGEAEIIPVPGVPGVRGLSIAADGRTLAFAGLALSSQIWVQPIRDGASAGAARPVTSDTSRRNSLPVVSPDGSKIAYVSTRGGENPNIWVMNADGSNATQVTSDESYESHPRWFPDSRRIAYMSSRGDTVGLWTADVATRREELLFDAGAVRVASDADLVRGPLAEVQLSPTLDRIAFSLMSGEAGRRRLYVATLRPFVARALTDGRESIGYPAWSPDQRSLAVEIKDGASTQLGVVDLGTGTVRRVTSDRGQTWVRSWSPDSRQVAVAALRDGTWSVRSIAVDTGREVVITPAGPPRVYARYPDWSARGDLVAFERGELHGNVWMLRIRQ